MLTAASSCRPTAFPNIKYICLNINKCITLLCIASSGYTLFNKVLFTQFRVQLRYQGCRDPQVGGNWIKMNYAEEKRSWIICSIFLPSKHSGKARQATRCFLTLCVPLNLDLYDTELIRSYSSGHREVVAPLNPSLSANLLRKSSMLDLHSPSAQKRRHGG